MLLLHRAPAGPRQVEVRLQPGATVADLADALGEAEPYVIDGRAWPGEVELVDTGLRDGSAVGGDVAAHDRAAASEPPARPVTTLHVVAGLDAGAQVPLPAGVAVVGRSPGAGVPLAASTVSGAHAELRVQPSGRVEVRDLGSRNGSWVAGRAARSWTALAEGDRARFGGVLVRIGRSDEPAPRAGCRPAAGRLVHHRPPRTPPAAAPDPVELPRAPSEGPPRPTLALASALLPALAGILIVAITGNWLFAVLPLMGPIIAVAAWWQGRRHVARVSRRERARHAADVAALEARLAGLVAHEEQRRRAASGDLAETVHRARAASPRLWERRPGHGDFLHLVVGEADVTWEPPLSGSVNASSAEVAAAVAEARRLFDVPVEVDLSEGGVVGIVGDPGAARAVARSLLLQAAVHHGPADVEVVVLGGGPGTADWSWARWLPHCRDRRAGGHLVVEGPDAARAADAAAVLAGELLDLPSGDGDGPVRLVVVDGAAHLAARRSPVRALLRGGAGAVAGIVVAADRHQLPASCTTVVEVEGSDGAAEVHDLRSGLRQPGVLLAGLAVARAQAAARSLAAVEDAELAGDAPVQAVGLADLLGSGGDDPDAVAATWAASWKRAGMPVPLGVDAEGVVPVDLVGDGPHALVAGTTGSGKSELLRSWVAGLAAVVDPRLLSIVLVDYKGGAAFDACAALPHVAAVVTDLDAALGARALQGLEAELRRRERALRDAGVADVAAQWAQGGDAPLPRLLVVVDEFATLAAELPEFLDALVGVAQRGRSLGVHLVLATQRPAGVINDAIRANTSLRVALRVEDPHDGLDVVGSDLPSRLPRQRPGAAVLRLGPHELVSLQVAHAAAPARHEQPHLVEVVATWPLDGPAGTSPEAGADDAPAPRDGASSPRAPSSGTQLDAVVAACREAARRLGLAAAPAPWPEPLPGAVGLDELGSIAGVGPTDPELVAAWLVDDPGNQARRLGGWRPAEGNLLVHGAKGSGTTTALLAVIAALAPPRRPADLHVYAVDAGGGGLAPLAGLPHTGAVVRLGDGERLGRLLDRLGAELERRRRARRGEAGGDGEPLVVLVVDGLASLCAELDQPGAVAQAELLQRWYLDGPKLGLVTVASADRPGAVRHQLAAATSQRLVLALADPLDARTLGIPAAAGPPGRGVELASGLAVQVAAPPPGSFAPGTGGDDIGTGEEGEGGGCGPARRPRCWAQPVGELAEEVDVSRLDGVGAVGERPWRVPIGLGGAELGPVCLTLHGGEHVLVAGPARSGRTTALVTTAEVLRRLGVDADLVAVLGRPSALAAAPVDLVLSAGGLGSLLEDARPGEGRGLVVLVDDAELLADEDGALERLVARRDGDVTVVAAGRADALRSSYTPWLRAVRQSRTGLLLHPDGDLDGDLLGVRLPRRHAAPMRLGRGYLVQDGEATLVHVARRSCATNMGDRE